MKKPVVIAISALLLSGSLSLAAEETSLSTLEDLVGQWVGLRGLVAAEEQAWHRQEQQWTQEIALLQEEERRLDAKIQQAKQFEAAKEDRTSQQLTKKAELETVLSALSEVVDRAAAELSELLPSIPNAIRSADLNRILEELNRPQAEDAPRSPARQLQLLVSTLTEIESLQHRSHAVREVLNLGPDMRREMDVLYLGLACGYAVSTDNSIAAMGSPSGSGWQWTIQPDIAAAVRSLIQIQKKEQPPALVTLPMVGIAKAVQP